jgi:hypothetical protein
VLTVGDWCRMLGRVDVAACRHTVHIGTALHQFTWNRIWLQVL